MALRFECAKGDFTALGGLALFEEMTKGLGLSQRLKELIPVSARVDHKKSFQKFKALMYGFVAGAEALDDMNVLTEDLGFQSVCKKPNTASSYGNYLRSFEVWQPRKLNEVLADVALKARCAARPHHTDFILDIDTSAHEHYAKKKEGLATNYAGKSCLDSLQAFDQFGFQYWFDLRAGNTYTCNGVSTVIERIFRKVPRRMRRYMRGDSGMCTFDIFRACINNNTDFVIAMRAGMYEPLVSRVRQWRPAKNIFFRDGSECEIGSTIYYPTGMSRALRVVVIRALKKQPELFGERYGYPAWVTSLGEHEKSHEEVVEFYKGRGNAENFIRELKNGYDLHHFPCQKLLANRVYGLIAAFAHNLMRLLSQLFRPMQPHFSKILRFKLVFIAAQVVKKAGYRIMRFSHHQHREVTYWLTTIKKQLGTG